MALAASGMMTTDVIVSACASLLDFKPAQITGDPEKRAIFIAYINDALTHIVDQGDWSWLFKKVDIATVTNSDVLELPADFEAFLPNGNPYYKDAAGYPLDRRSMAYINALNNVGTRTISRPVIYAPIFTSGTTNELPGHRLLVWPTASAVYEIVLPYRRRVPRVSQLTDIPQIPEALHETLKILAMAEAEEQWTATQVGSQRLKGEARLLKAWARYSSPIRGQGKIRVHNFIRDGSLDLQLEDEVVVEVITPTNTS